MDFLEIPVINSTCRELLDCGTVNAVIFTALCLEHRSVILLLDTAEKKCRVSLN